MKKADAFIDQKIRHNCTENDNHFFLLFEDGELGEIWVGDALEKSWTIIGFKDLRDGLRSAGLEVIRREFLPASPAGLTLAWAASPEGEAWRAEDQGGTR